jgi:hypothetical protein
VVAAGDGRGGHGWAGSGAKGASCDVSGKIVEVRLKIMFRELELLATRGLRGAHDPAGGDEIRRAGRAVGIDHFTRFSQN